MDSQLKFITGPGKLDSQLRFITGQGHGRIGQGGRIEVGSQRLQVSPRDRPGSLRNKQCDALSAQAAPQRALGLAHPQTADPRQESRGSAHTSFAQSGTATILRS